MIYKNIIFNISLAKEKDLAKILYLQNQVYLSLENKAHFIKARRSDFLKTLQNGFIFLVHFKKQLVAYSCCEFNLPEGFPIVFKEKRIARLKNTVVKEKYRGHNLQKN